MEPPTNPFCPGNAEVLDDAALGTDLAFADCGHRELRGARSGVAPGSTADSPSTFQ